MPKLFFSQNASCNLPPGFRFEPTDEEIVFQYLACKALSRPLPASIVPEIDVFAMDPWDLSGELKQDRYFFCNMASNETGRMRKSTCTGFWKPLGFQKLIICPSRMPIVGIKKTLVFYKGKNHPATRTDWFMHVYYIALAPTKPRRNHPFQRSLTPLGKWVLCHVFSKKNGSDTTKNILGREVSDADSSFSDTKSSTLDEVSSTNSE